MPSSSISRRPGGQPGNTNALKHGYYARKLPQADLIALQDHHFSGLQEEILVQRVFINRLVEHLGECHDFEKTLSISRIFSLALISLSRLMRTEQFLRQDFSGLQVLFSQAFPAIIDKLNGLPSPVDEPSSSGN